MKISRYSEDDQKKVLDLFFKVYGKNMTNEFWDWRFNDNRFGEPIRYLMWEDDDVIGNYVVHPLPMKIGDSIENVLLSMDTFTHPDHRGKGVITRLANITYQEAEKSNYKLVLGFPIQNSYRTFFDKLDWINFGNVLEYQKTIEVMDPTLKIDNSYKINQIHEFDNKVDKIWESNKEKFNFLVARTKEYLNWRFFKHPKIKFTDHLETQYFSYIVSNNGKPEAYFVLKKFGNKKGHLIDYFGHLNEEILAAILSYSVLFCIKNKLELLTCWYNTTNNNELSTAYRKFGFTPTALQTYWGIRLFEKSFDKAITDKAQWFITMSDSDVY